MHKNRLYATPLALKTKIDRIGGGPIFRFTLSQSECAFFRELAKEN